MDLAWKETLPESTSFILRGDCLDAPEEHPEMLFLPLFFRVDSRLALKALPWLAPAVQFSAGLNCSTFYKMPESGFLASYRALYRGSQEAVPGAS